MAHASCPVCTGELAPGVSGGSYVLRCSSCGWCVATTNRDQPGFDRTLYCVRATAGQLRASTAAARLAVALGMRGSEVARLLSEDLPIGSYRAEEVLDIMARLAPLGFSVSTEPPFPWGPQDGA